MIIRKQDVIKKISWYWISKIHAQLLICSELKISYDDFFVHNELEITPEHLEKIVTKAKKINFGYPIEYALNSAEFYWYDFYVDENCLIPRDDTEIMVEKALLAKQDMWDNTVSIDVWTWSWAIPISIYKESWTAIENTDFFAIDISETALNIAKKNAHKHNVEESITFLHWSLLDPFIRYMEQNTAMMRDIIDTVIVTANLPYIKWWDYENMDAEVYTYEPEIALYWGKETGFELYEELLYQVISLQKKYTIATIIVFIEIWFDQESYARSYLSSLDLDFEMYTDSWWVNRCVKIDFSKA